jgi:hypothetical protein
MLEFKVRGKMMKNIFWFLSMMLFCWNILAQTQAASGTAPASASSQTLPAGSSAPTTGVSSTQIERSSWLDKTNVSLFSFGSVGIPSQEKGNASLFFYNYIAFNYRFSKTQRISFRPTFTYVSGGTNRFGDEVGEEVIPDDFHIVYSDYDLGELAGAEVGGSARVYLPTGRNSQAQRLITRTRGELYFSYDVRQFSKIGYVIKADLLFHNERAYRNNDVVTDRRGQYTNYPIQANKYAALEHFIEYTGDITKSLSFEPQAGFKEDWRYSSSVEGIDDFHKTSFVAAAGFRVRFGRAFDMKLALENETRLDSSPIAYGRPENNSWLLETNVRF